jgi:hypothetical protein
MNKRDEARKIYHIHNKAFRERNEAQDLMNKTEDELAELAQQIKPDPECNCAISSSYDGVQVCTGCFTALKR